VLGLVLAILGIRPAISSRTLFYFLIVCLLGTILPNSFSYWAISHLQAGIVAIAIATVPMFTLVLALGLRLEKPSILRLCGVLTGFAAVVMLIVPDTSLPEPEAAIFVVVALIAPLCYGAEANYVAEKAPAGVDPVSTIFLAALMGIVITGPLAVASGQWIDITRPWGNPEVALVASSVIHALTYCGYIWLVGFGGAVFSAQIAYPVTLSGMFFSILLLDETYSNWVWAALVMVIIGLAMVQPRKQEKG